MYKSVIDIFPDVPQSTLESLRKTADKAFDNRAGKAKNMSTMPYRMSFEGEERQFGCLQLGMLALEKEKSFLPFVSSWNWIDEDEPDENEDILATMRIPLR